MAIIDSSMIKIEIDGVEFNAKKGSKIIEVADEVGIYIPRFCYHKKLSIAANCRMCLVEVLKTPKLFPACATPITEGMKIFTNTEKVIEAQKAVMEFLLINHPLDCPICDQGGECELQDLTVGYGCTSSRFIEKKRSFDDYDLGPLIATDVTRCILCSRCVRFCEEISGTKEIGIINRGSNSRIFTFLKQHIISEISGNIIDICPVGALTAKPSRFKFRAWELFQYPFISYHDCTGSNLYVHVFKDKIIRVVPKKNDSINESWISDRDRFSYEGLYNNDRINYPMIKQNGKWKHVTWIESFEYIFNKINYIKKEFGPNQLACLASTNSTVEEFFILQKFFRNLDSNNIDHRLKQIDFSYQDKIPVFVGLDISLNEISNMDCIFLIGSDIVKEQPIIALKFRKLINNGGKIFVLNPIDFEFFMDLNEKFIVNPGKFLDILKHLHKQFSIDFKFQKSNLETENYLDNFNFNSIKNISNCFLNSKNKLIILGSYATSNPDYSKILSLSIALSKISNSFFGVLTDGSNTSGAWLSGFIPHRLPGGKSITNNIGLNAFNILSKKLKAYILFGLELEYDCLYSDIAVQALKNAEFVLAFASFNNKIILEHSTVVLPITSSYENSGTFINVSGVFQTFSAVIPHEYEVKYGWKAINDLADYFKFSGFSYKESSCVLTELKSLININEYIHWNLIDISDLKTVISDKIIILNSIPIYGIDSLVRRATSLQKIYKKKIDSLKCNRITYNLLQLEDNVIYVNTDIKKIKYFISVDNTISDNVIFFEDLNIIDCKKFQLSYDVFKFEKQ